MYVSGRYFTIRVYVPNTLSLVLLDNFCFNERIVVDSAVAEVCFRLHEVLDEPNYCTLRNGVIIACHFES